MAELSWKSILRAQQQDFIKRLKFSYDTRNYSDELLRFSTLTVVDEYCIPATGFSSEIVELYFDNEHENKIHDFCCGLVEKYQDSDSNIYLEDSYKNYKIGKLGEEAVKEYLGDIISEVNYELSEYGDGGIDFTLATNHKIKIQVKTISLNRVSCYHIDKYQLTDNDIGGILQAPEQYCFGAINNNSWSISSEESCKNHLLICVLLLNPIDCDRIINDTYRCLMAGFIPIEKRVDKQSFKMDELLYMGGLKGYLEYLQV